MKCKHLNYNFTVKAGQIVKEGEENNPNAEIQMYVGEIRVACANCGVEFQFIGAQAGFSFNVPSTNETATLVFLPMIPINKPRVITKEVN